MSLLLPPVLLSFLLFLLPSNNREEEGQGAGASVVERPRRRRPSVFPLAAHPGRSVEDIGRKEDGRNGNNKSSAPAGYGGAGGGWWKWLKERDGGKIDGREANRTLAPRIKWLREYNKESGRLKRIFYGLWEYLGGDPKERYWFWGK
uniref:Uncharacterized protein n=1 Tax=Oryza glaberrima TaxID=4538 RepID=I1QG09_ORYGL